MTTIPAGLLEGHARDAFFNIVSHYNLKPHTLLRAILEHALDAASEDINWERVFVESAQECERTGRVPNCWLELEGDDSDAEPDTDAEPDCDAEPEDEGGDDDEDLDTAECHDVRPA